MRFVAVTLVCVGVLFFNPLSCFSQKQKVVETISFILQEQDSEIIEIHLNETNIPKIFRLSGENPRLVLDFLDTTYKGKSKLEAKDGELVRGIRVGFHKNPKLKTRVVVDLASDREIYWNQDFRPDENLLVLSIKGGGSITAAPLPVVLPPATSKNKPVEAAGQTGRLEVADAREQLTNNKHGADDVPEKKTVETENSANSSNLKTNAAQIINNGPVLLDVAFDNVYAKSGEMVLFKLNDFHPPSVSAIEKGQPRIICDFLDARMHKNVPKEIEANGKLIEKIRVARHADPDKIRVVLDLLAGNDYDLQQVFFKEDNLFVLIVNTLEPEVSAADNQ